MKGAKHAVRRALHGLFVDAVRITAEWNNVAAANGIPEQLALPAGAWGFSEGLLLGKALRAKTAQDAKP